MTAAARYLAFDLGAESGRAMGASFDGARLALEELHRFPTGPVRVLDSLHWDVLRLLVRDANWAGQSRRPIR